MAQSVDVKECLALVRAWQQEPLADQLCPVCRAGGLEIIDRSARPHAEWYQLNCAACGFEQAVHVPLTSAGLG